MGTYDGLFKDVEACGQSTGGLTSLADLGKKSSDGFQFPSLDALNEACEAVPQSRDFIKGVEYIFSNNNKPTGSWDVRDLLSFPDNTVMDVIAWFINSGAILAIFFVIPVMIGMWIVKRTGRKGLGILAGLGFFLIICAFCVASPDFNGVKDEMRYFLDPLTEPLSWGLAGTISMFSSYTTGLIYWGVGTVILLALAYYFSGSIALVAAVMVTSLFFAFGALHLFVDTPWFIMIPLLVGISYYLSRTIGVTILVAITLAFYAFVNIYDSAMETLGIVLLCTFVSVLIGVPVGIAMSKRDWLRDLMIPILDLLQTLPSFVYLVPLLLLFSATAPKLYGIAIMLYAIVPVIRLTNLGIRLVDEEVIEAAHAFGMTSWQKLTKVQIPLALPNIMAGVNQTVMMSLAMVVIASMVSAPGLGKFVLRAIRNIEIGTGLVYGLAIVLMAVCLDRVSKAALNRLNAGQ